MSLLEGVSSIAQLSDLFFVLQRCLFLSVRHIRIVSILGLCKHICDITKFLDKENARKALQPALKDLFEQYLKIIAEIDSEELL